MNRLTDLNLKDKRVLIRVDFNVPLGDGFQITDDSRMQAHLPTIKKVLEMGGKPIIISHLGRPKGQYDKKYSLTHLKKHLGDISGHNVTFGKETVGPEAENAANSLKTGELLLLENLRFNPGETAGEAEFAKKLAKLADVYVNDAFGTAHRAHASTAIVAEFFEEKAVGLVMQKEIENVSKVLKGGKSPVTAIVGGAKVSSKISVLENLLPKIDNLIIGGGMAYTFIKAQGGEIGASLVEDDLLETALTILDQAKKQNTRVLLPIDSVNADAFANEAKKSFSASNNIPEGYMGLDAGPKSLEQVREVIVGSNTILWNGPMGVFEFSNFAEGTRRVAEFIAEATEKGAFSLVGGGDSVAAIKKFDMANRVSYVSTGGGAMLEFLEGKELPGIKAMN